MSEDYDEANTGTELIAKGAQLAGALVGGTLGLLGGPVGSIGGAAGGWATGEVIAAIGMEVMERMSGRGSARAAATALLIVRDGQQRESDGETPRSDSFYEPRGALRPEEEELLEAILLTAANTFEERKLPYLANLFNAVKFDPTVRTADALFLSRVGDQLTYRQLVGLAVIGDPAQYEMELALIRTSHEDGSMLADPGFMSELDDLAVRELVGAIAPDDDTPRSPTAYIETSKLTDIPFTRYRLTPKGERLHHLTQLDRTPKAEVDQWLIELRGQLRTAAT